MNKKDLKLKKAQAIVDNMEKLGYSLLTKKMLVPGIVIDEVLIELWAEQFGNDKNGGKGKDSEEFKGFKEISEKDYKAFRRDIVRSLVVATKSIEGGKFIVHPLSDVHYSFGTYGEGLECITTEKLSMKFAEGKDYSAEKCVLYFVAKNAALNKIDMKKVDYIRSYQSDGPDIF